MAEWISVKDKKILDVTCGSRTIWFNKNGEENLGPENHIWYGFEVEDPKEYKYYKFVFREDGIMQLSEIQLLGKE